MNFGKNRLPVPCVLWMICFAAGVATSQAAFAAEGRSQGNNPAAGRGETAREAGLRQFLDRHCVACHGTETQEATFRFDELPKASDAAGMDRWQAAIEQISFQRMPPATEEQPTLVEREQAIAWIEDGLGIPVNERLNLTEKLRLPGYGNFVDHDQLFAEPTERRAATPVRLWRISPHIFMKQANLLTGIPFLRPFGNQGGDGLHPAFSYMTPKHVFRDHADVHLLEEATTELLFDVSWQVASLQMVSPRPQASVRAILATDAPTDDDWRRAAQTQALLALHRELDPAELSRLVELARRVQSQEGRDKGLQSLLAAILLKPDAVYRVEKGASDPDRYGRVRLAPIELATALGFALNDLGPDAALLAAAREGRLVSRDDLRREVSRLLENREWTQERMLRFFQEYFEYPAVGEVFKDQRKANATFVNNRIADADALVTWIVNEDREVLRRLLTEDRLFVMVDGMPNREPPELRARAHYLPDFGFPEDWTWESTQPLLPISGRRSGLLTHPAWLMSFSDNEKNQAIQRGRWIQFKLLGGVIPDVPVGVDARFPPDPTLSLREKMVVTRQEYCWRCHQKMDPLGLPLEQFDDFGRYRETELERPVVTSGEIHSGDSQLDGPVSDPFEMLSRLAASTRVEQVFVRHVFRYFLGRNETLADGPTLVDAHRAYVDHGGSLRALIESLLNSDSFYFRQLPGDTPAARTSESLERR